MISERYCVIGFGCILSKNQILYLYEKYLPNWNLKDGFNMDSLIKTIKKKNISTNIYFYHDHHSFDKVFLTIKILEDNSRYNDHSFKNLDLETFKDDNFINNLNEEMKKTINLLNIEINDFGWKIYNYRI